MGFIFTLTPEWSVMNTLAFICGTLWTFTYIAVIWIGIRDKTCCMPIEALAFNFAWEVMFGAVWLYMQPGANLQAYVNVLWAIFDLGILYTFFRWGITRGASPKLFKVYGLAVVLFAFAIFIAWFKFDFPEIENLHAVSAWIVNGIMSLMFLRLLWSRGPAGQSLWIAWGKGLGTFAVTIAYTFLPVNEELNLPVIIVTGWICFAFDLAYIFLLWRAKRSAKANAA